MTRLEPHAQVFFIAHHENALGTLVENAPGMVVIEPPLRDRA